MSLIAPEIAPAPAPLLDRALVTAFLEHVPDFVYFKDRDSRFIALSASMMHLFNQKNTSGVIGKSDFDFFNQAHARPAFEDEQTIIRTGQPMLGKLEKETWPDGHVTWVLTSKMPLRNAQGEIIGTFGISKDVTESKKMEAALEQSRRDLVDASRQAGMAEVATGVLHNVGNVLNSLNVSSTLVATGLRASKAESLTRLATLLRENSDDLATFLTTDAKGQHVPAFIESLASHFTAERDRLLLELDSLQRNVDHIKEIISMQQAYATMVGHVEPLEAAALMEDAVSMNGGSLQRHEVRVVRDFLPVPTVSAEKGKVLQILINVIRNAKYACDEGGCVDKIITLRIAPGAPGRVLFSVSDNGIGIPAENLTKIFNHGFTTRATGHGFGVHSSANAAKEMKGSLTVFSAGPGQGATFTLELPAAPEAAGTPA